MRAVTNAKILELHDLKITIFIFVENKLWWCGHIAKTETERERIMSTNTESGRENVIEI